MQTLLQMRNPKCKREQCGTPQMQNPECKTLLQMQNPKCNGVGPQMQMEATGVVQNPIANAKPQRQTLLQMQNPKCNVSNGGDAKPQMQNPKREQWGDEGTLQMQILLQMKTRNAV